MTRLLLLDDEPSILKALKRTIRIPDCIVDIFERPEDAVAALGIHSYSLIMSDYRMPRMDGVSFLKIAKERQPEAMRIILSGYTDVSGLLAAINEAEIYRFIPKPWDDIELVMTLKKTLEYADLLDMNQRLLAQIDAQQKTILRQQTELRCLEEESPGITQVNRSDDGYIIIDDFEM